jgi:SpoVK/Ycf46/Vps4 family AAA+-type ATPase
LLQALTRKFTLSPDVNLEAVAARCAPQLTGADLYALCADAWMHAFKRAVSRQQPTAETSGAQYGGAWRGAAAGQWLLSKDESEDDGDDSEGEEGLGAREARAPNGFDSGKEQEVPQQYISGSSSTQARPGGGAGDTKAMAVPFEPPHVDEKSEKGDADGKSEKDGKSEAGSESESDGGEYHGIPWDDPQWDGHPPPEILPEALAARKAAHEARVAARQAAKAAAASALGGVDAGGAESASTAGVDSSQAGAGAPPVAQLSASTGESLKAAAAAAAAEVPSALPKVDGRPAEDDRTVVVVDVRDFEAALASLVPSLSLEEVAKYERLRDHYESRDSRR